MTRIRIIGLDGGTFAVIDYLVSRNRLKNFARAMDEGCRAVLNSAHPPLTPAAWASFYTGTNPGKTGAVDFFRRLPDTYRLAPVNGRSVRGVPIWDVAGSHGKRVCVYNVPVTYPASPVNGIMISGMDAPHLDEVAVHPRELRAELIERFGPVEIEPSIDARYLIRNSDDPDGEYIKRFRNYLEMQIDIVKYLAGREDWDLFVSVFRSPDGFQHAFWQDLEAIMSGDEVSDSVRRRGEAILSCYERLDEEIGVLLDDDSGDYNLVLMSDHGFGVLEGEVCVNRILAEAGLLSFRKKGAVRRIKEAVFSGLSSRITGKMRQRILKLLRNDGKTGFLYVDSLIADIDWENTRVYSLGQFGCLYLNRQGREPAGIVTEDESRTVLAEAEAALRAYRHPGDGRPLFTEFYHGDDIYSGPMRDSLPDLLVVMRNHAYRGVYSTSAELDGEDIIRMPCPEWGQLAPTGCHRREGILVMYGADINHVELGPRDMVDIAPTVLNLMGLPSAGLCDGEIITEAIKGGERRTVEEKPEAAAGSREGTEDQVYSEEDEEEVRKRLEDLGYL